jgi:hypothetical protein
MGREVRRVPADWVHPLSNRGCTQPMRDQSFREATAEWKEGFRKWEEGYRRRRSWGDEHEQEPWVLRTGSELTIEFWELYGNPPDREYYRPDWPEESRTHYQMYETTTEGTPISPVFSTPEELARWLTETEASAFADMTATYEQWLRVCRGGYAPSAVADETGLRSGVAGLP